MPCREDVHIIGNIGSRCLRLQQKKLCLNLVTSGRQGTRNGTTKNVITNSTILGGCLRRMPFFGPALCDYGVVYCDSYSWDASHRRVIALQNSPPEQSSRASARTAHL